MPSAKCKLCPHVAISFAELKDHWRKIHTKQYVAIQTWLMDVDEAIVVAECITSEQETGQDPREIKDES